MRSTRSAGEVLSAGQSLSLEQRLHLIGRSTLMEGRLVWANYVEKLDAASFSTNSWNKFPPKRPSENSV